MIPSRKAKLSGSGPDSADPNASGNGAGGNYLGVTSADGRRSGNNSRTSSFSAAGDSSASDLVVGVGVAGGIGRSGGGSVSSGSSDSGIGVGVGAGRSTNVGVGGRGGSGGEDSSSGGTASLVSGRGGGTGSGSDGLGISIGVGMSGGSAASGGRIGGGGWGDASGAGASSETTPLLGNAGGGGVATSSGGGYGNSNADETAVHIQSSINRGAINSGDGRGRTGYGVDEYDSSSSHSSSSNDSSSSSSNSSFMSSSSTSSRIDAEYEKNRRYRFLLLTICCVLLLFLLLLFVYFFIFAVPVHSHRTAAVCNPFSFPPRPKVELSEGHGLLVYLHVANLSVVPTYLLTDVSHYAQYVPTPIQSPFFFSNVNTTTRRFTQTFYDRYENAFFPSQYFYMEFWSTLRLPKPGVYEFALLADDGAVFHVRPSVPWSPNNGVAPKSQALPAPSFSPENWRLIVNDDGIHTTRLSTCQNNLITVMNVDTDGQWDVHLQYFQGPAPHIALMLLYRFTELQGVRVRDEPLEGVEGNDAWFTPPTPPNFDNNNNNDNNHENGEEAFEDVEGTPTSRFVELQSRGWAVLPQEWFYLPAEAMGRYTTAVCDQD